MQTSLQVVFAFLILEYTTSAAEDFQQYKEKRKFIGGKKVIKRYRISFGGLELKKKIKAAK